jgi:hypothetical protein
MSQPFTKQLARAVQLRFDSADCGVGHVRDLFVFVAFYVMQHEDLPRACRQGCNGLFQIQPIVIVRAAASQILEHFRFR